MIKGMVSKDKSQMTKKVNSSNQFVKAKTTPHFKNIDKQKEGQYVFEIFDTPSPKDDFIKFDKSNNNNSAISLIQDSNNLNNVESNSSMIKDFLKDEDSVTVKPANHTSSLNQNETNSVPIEKHSVDNCLKSKDKVKRQNEPKPGLNTKEIIKELLLTAREDSKGRQTIRLIEPQLQKNSKVVKAKPIINHKTKFQLSRKNIKSNSIIKKKIRNEIYDDIRSSIARNNLNSSRKQIAFLKQSKASLFTFAKKNSNLFASKDGNSSLKQGQRHIGHNDSHAKTHRKEFKEEMKESNAIDEENNKDFDRKDIIQPSLLKSNRERYDFHSGNADVRCLISKRVIHKPRVMKKSKSSNYFLQDNLTNRSDRLLKSYFS